MDEGFKKCPKCQGDGKKEYVYSLIGIILRNFALLKEGDSIDNLICSKRKIRLICPFCEGNGTVDWVKWPMRQNFNNPFSNLEGCLDIFLNQIPVKQWYFNPPDRNGCKIIDDLSEYSNPEKIIKLSQNRYDAPITLNNDFLTMTYDKLEKIAGILDWRHLEITAHYSEGNVQKYLKKAGLLQYMPDKFVYPDPNDIDKNFF